MALFKTCNPRTQHLFGGHACFFPGAKPKTFLLKNSINWCPNHRAPSVHIRIDPPMHVKDGISGEVGLGNLCVLGRSGK